jgi:ComF family protein
MASTAAHEVAQIIVPGGCAFCGQRLPPKQHNLCRQCHADLPWIRPRFHLDPLTAALAPLAYSFPIDAAIKRFKFQRKLFYGPAFRCLLDQAARELPHDIDALLPMPLHWRRLAARGFNQAAEISGGVRRAMCLPVVTNVRRIRHTPYQSGLAAAQRRRNLRGAFRASGAVAYRHVLIIDDVITTGETCRGLASALLGAGVERVSVLAIARSTPG